MQLVAELIELIRIRQFSDSYGSIVGQVSPLTTVSCMNDSIVADRTGRLPVWSAQIDYSTAKKNGNVDMQRTACECNVGIC